MHLRLIMLFIGNTTFSQRIYLISSGILWLKIMGSNKPCSHLLPPTPSHSHSLLLTPTHYLPLPSTPAYSHALPLICSPLPSISTFFTHSHLFSSHSYPLPLMFSPLLLNLSPLSPMYSLSHLFPVHIQTVQIIYSQVYFSFWNYCNVSSRRLEC